MRRPTRTLCRVTRRGGAHGAPAKEGLSELTRRESKPTSVHVGDRTVAAIRSTFEITTRATHARTRFDVSVGTDGSLAGVPLAAEWQPRWWLRVALTLQEPAVP